MFVSLFFRKRKLSQSLNDSNVIDLRRELIFTCQLCDTALVNPIRFLKFIYIRECLLSLLLTPRKQEQWTLILINSSSPFLFHFPSQFPRNYILSSKFTLIFQPERFSKLQLQHSWNLSLFFIDFYFVLVFGLLLIFSFPEIARIQFRSDSLVLQLLAPLVNFKCICVLTLFLLTRAKK